MFLKAIDDYQMVFAQSIPTSFDRGLPDVIGYLMLCELPVPKEMLSAASRFHYHWQVFITPPWEEIYRNDAERKQDFDEPVRTYEKMIGGYDRLGYELVEVPKFTID